MTVSKEVTVFGSAGTITSPPAKLTSGQVLDTRTPASWAFHGGKSAGFAVLGTDGRLVIVNSDLSNDGYLPTGTEFLISEWDPVAEVLTHYNVPTSLAVTSVVGSNGLVGGAFGGCIAVGQIGGVDYEVALTTHPYGPTYSDWPIGTDGEFPVVAAFKRVAGVRTYDPTRSFTTKQIHLASLKGGMTFPLATNSFGETYGNDQAVSECAFLPASGVLVVCQYFTNAVSPSDKGGAVFTLDLATGIVTSFYTIPWLSTWTPVGHANTLRLSVDLTGTLGHEVFSVGFDNAGGMMLLAYDHIHGTIAPVTKFLSPTTDTSWGRSCFDADGWFHIMTGHGLFGTILNVFPKVEGQWQFSGAPYAWPGTGAHPPGGAAQSDWQASITPQFQVNVGDGATLATTIRYDPTTKTVLVPGGSIVLTPVAKAGDAHAPVFTQIPGISLGFSSYASHPMTVWPGGTGLDVAGRLLHWAIGEVQGSGEPYPETPQVEPSYLITFDLNQCVQQPVFILGSTKGGNATATAFTTTLPTGWAAGDLAIVEVSSTLASTVGNISPPTGWTRIQEHSPSTFGGRFAAYCRILQAGDDNPTFTNPSGTPGENWLATVYRGADPTNPINVSGLTDAATGTTLTAPSVTTTVPGCRIVHVFGAIGAQTFSGIGETNRAEQDNILAGTAATLVTETPIVQAAAGATGTVAVTDSVSTRHGAITIAIAPAPAPANPPAVTSVTLDHSDVIGGAVVNVTVTLASAAPAQGVLASLIASDPVAVAAPATVLIPSGQTSATVAITTLVRQHTEAITLTANSGTGSANAALTIESSATTVYHDLFAASGAALAGILVEITPLPLTAGTGLFLPGGEPAEIRGTMQVYTDGNGHWSATLPGNGLLSPPGSLYLVVEHVSGAVNSVRISLPSSGGPYALPSVEV